MKLTLLAAAFLTTSAALAGEPATAKSRHDPTRPVHLLTVLIGGIESDPTPAQISRTADRLSGNSGLYRFAGDITRERFIPEYFNWNGTRAGKIRTKDPPGSPGIADFIRRHLHEFPGDRVALVGNSWGGHTALEVAQRLCQSDAPLAVNLVVFLDASSAARRVDKVRVLPVNVNRAVNYSTRNVFVWGKWDAGRRLENVDLGDPKEGFLIEGGPAYNAPFETRAHVAAEWDEAIHADIRRRLLELLPPIALGEARGESPKAPPAVSGEAGNRTACSGGSPLLHGEAWDTMNSVP
jgi:pimeloyl-ACP methyl ester carboxylesterase